MTSDLLTGHLPGTWKLSEDGRGRPDCLVSKVRSNEPYAHMGVPVALFLFCRMNGRHADYCSHGDSRVCLKSCRELNVKRIRMLGLVCRRVVQENKCLTCFLLKLLHVLLLN